MGDHPPHMLELDSFFLDDSTIRFRTYIDNKKKKKSRYSSWIWNEFEYFSIS